MMAFLYIKITMFCLFSLHDIKFRLFTQPAEDVMTQMRSLLQKGDVPVISYKYSGLSSTKKPMFAVLEEVQEFFKPCCYFDRCDVSM